MSDFILLAMEGGHVALTFNNFAMLDSATLKLTSSNMYNDTEIHRVYVLFEGAALTLSVNSADNSTENGLCPSVRYPVHC